MPDIFISHSSDDNDVTRFLSDRVAEAGFDVWVEDAYGGTLKLETPLIKCGVPLEEIGYEDEVFDNSGILPRYLKVFRLPADNPHRAMRFTRKIDLKDSGDNPIFIRLTQEDGTLAWTSPIYLFR